ncbi:transposase IS3/IS911 family protein [Mycobacterium tuberculosis]|nr:transposase IS3/IS911 family protein [Mycobacterium tuberculosis]
MRSPHPPEFRHRAVEPGRTGDKPVAAPAKSLGISQSCLSNWIRIAAQRLPRCVVSQVVAL